LMSLLTGCCDLLHVSLDRLRFRSSFQRHSMLLLFTVSMSWCVDPLDHHVIRRCDVALDGLLDVVAIHCTCHSMSLRFTACVARPNFGSWWDSIPVVSRMWECALLWECRWRRHCCICDCVKDVGVCVVVRMQVASPLLHLWLATCYSLRVYVNTACGVCSANCWVGRYQSLIIDHTVASRIPSLNVVIWNLNSHSLLTGCLSRDGLPFAIASLRAFHHSVQTRMVPCSLRCCRGCDPWSWPCSARFGCDCLETWGVIRPGHYRSWVAVVPHRFLGRRCDPEHRAVVPLDL